MSFGAVGGAVAGGLASGIGSSLLGGGGGGGSSRAAVTPFRSPGVLANFNDVRGRFNIAERPERRTLIDQIQQALRGSADATRSAVPRFNDIFGRGIGETQGLLDRVAPGVSELRENRLKQIENIKAASRSTLTENLARRRVGGSSFANDTATRQDLAFADQIDKVEAESFLQEIELTNNFLQQRLDLEVGQIDTELKNLLSAFQFDQSASQVDLENQNFLAGIATQMATGATASATQLKAQELQLAAQSSAGAGQFFGSIDYEGIFDGLFGGGGSSGGTAISNPNIAGTQFLLS